MAESTEAKRKRRLELLQSKEPLWRDEDHPELKDGAAAWVRKSREEWEARFEKVQKQRNAP